MKARNVALFGLTALVIAVAAGGCGRDGLNADTAALPTYRYQNGGRTEAARLEEHSRAEYGQEGTRSFEGRSKDRPGKDA